MSLARFKSQNHPQQVGQRGARAEVDERATDPALFAIWNERWRFTVDVCALPHNAKCERFWTPEDDGLAQDWSAERVWCNPPYSSIEPWLEKAWASKAALVVMLVPANRTEQGWWHRQVEPWRDNGGPLRVEFLPGRIRFIAAGATRVGQNERPPFGSALLIWDGDLSRTERPQQLGLEAA